MHLNAHKMKIDGYPLPGKGCVISEAGYFRPKQCQWPWIFLVIEFIDFSELFSCAMPLNKNNSSGKFGMVSKDPRLCYTCLQTGYFRPMVLVF